MVCELNIKGAFHGLSINIILKVHYVILNVLYEMGHNMI